LDAGDVDLGCADSLYEHLWPDLYAKNYDSQFHGPVTVRSALANSYNMPAVKTLDFVGLPAFLDNAKTFGITTLTRDDYGWR